MNNYVIYYAKIGNIEFLKLLLNAGAKATDTDIQGNTALHDAKNREIVRELLQWDANIHSVNKNGSTALLLSAEEDRFEVLCELADKGANIHTRDNISQSPLIKACEKGYFRIVRELLKRGAKVNRPDTYLTTPLLAACEYMHIDIVRELLKYGAQPNAINIYGHTPLMKLSVAKACPEQLEIIKLLFAYNAKVDIVDNSKKTSLHLASYCSNLGVVELLIHQGAELNSIDIHGNTPLIYASMTNNIEIASILLMKGAQINFMNTECKTAIHIACEWNSFDAAMILLNWGSDIEIEDIEGMTVLMIASRSGYSMLVKLLLENHALINRSDGNGWTALMYASFYRHYEIVELLLKYNANTNMKGLKKGETALTIAYNKKDINIMKQLLLHGADANIMINNSTLLIKSVKQDDLDMVCVLLDNGAFIDTPIKPMGMNALMIAIQDNKYKIVLELLNRGADITKEDDSGWIALTYSCWTGNYDIYSLLINKRKDYITSDHYSLCIHVAELGDYKRILNDMKDRYLKYGYMSIKN